MSPQVVVAIFGIIIILLSIWKPQAGRITMGIFYLVMALGVNLSLLLLDPSLYSQAGSRALLGIYRWFFTTILPLAPAVFIIGLILVEITIGVLILSKEKYARYGIIAAIIFCILITPVGIEEITCPIIAIGLAFQLRRNYPQSILDLLKSSFLRTKKA